nr:helix-hairpin-helix domain-containing protein [uncultured Prevotella sp.]
MFLNQFFYLQRNDRRAILVILVVVVVALAAVFFIGGRNRRSLSLTDSLDQPLRQQERWRQGYPYSKGYGGSFSQQGLQLAPFDPNTADSTQLLHLGLAPWQVRSLYHYRAKGGIFRKPSDFARLYGLTKKQFRTLAPYIRISDDYAPAAGLYPQTGNRSPEDLKHEDTIHYSYPVKLKLGQQISLNASDTSSLQKIPGIGSAYARAIINYRNRLGGFYSVKQIEEIGGVPPEAEKYLKVSPSGIHRLKINQLTVNQLRRHPYINFYQARTIYDYRRLHGPIKNLNQLANDRDFPPAEIARLAPYIDYGL